MFICVNCRQPYPEQGVPDRCPKCHGVFDVEALTFDAAQVDVSLPGVWRYRRTFGLPEEAPIVSLGEGNTPLVWSEIPLRTRQPRALRVAFKCEYQNPSGSFKDRGAATLVSFLCSRGVREAIEDSSGNAGASFAAYAARADLRARVYVPQTASGPKRKQIEAYGAEIVAVPGERSKAAEAARREADSAPGPHFAYASHAYLPFNLPGYATLAYEIVDQLGGSPGSVIIPAGQGGLLLGAARGFEALRRAGEISKMPQLIGVQAQACAPLWAYHAYGAAGLQWVTEAPTLAEGVRVRHPVRGEAVLRAVEASGGRFVSVAEPDILPGRDVLARRGFYVEPTSAIVWDALAQLGDSLSQPVVAVLTGAGLKTLD